MTESPIVVKCLVWDLDNTLWTGTLAEGDPVRPTEEARRLIRTLDERGILQSVVSRNDHDRAWSKLEEFGLAEFFVIPRIAWGPKSASVREIADTLRFDLHAVAFVDDQQVERAEVAFHVPQVRCYTASDVADLGERPEFTPKHVTADSARRRAMYQDGFRRTAAQESFSGPGEQFLRSLDLRMTISRADELDLARVEELTLRTSQMNATGVHYPLDTLRGLCADPRHEVLIATLEDRFGEHGAIGIVLLDRHSDVWHLRLLATSCRVVPVGAGAALLTWLADQAVRAGVHLLADFRPTTRNRMTEIAYRFSGFTDDVCPCTAAMPTAQDVQRLHLVPQPSPPPATVAIDAPTLTTAVRAPD